MDVKSHAINEAVEGSPGWWTGERRYVRCRWLMSFERISFVGRK